MITKVSMVAALSERVTSEYAQQALINENLAKGSYSDTIALKGLPENRQLARSIWKQLAREPFSLVVLCEILEASPVLDEEQVRFILADPRPKAVEYLFELGMKYIPVQLGRKLIEEGVVTSRLAAAWLGGENDRERVPRELLSELCLIADWDWAVDALRSDPNILVQRALEVIVNSKNTFTHPWEREIFTARPEVGHAVLEYAIANAEARLMRAVLGSNLELSSQELRGALECVRDRLLNDPYLFRYQYSVDDVLGCIARNLASEQEVAREARSLLGSKLQKVYERLPKYYKKSEAGMLWSKYQYKASGTPPTANSSSGYAAGQRWGIYEISQSQLVEDIQPILDRFGVLGWSTFFEMAEEWHSSLDELLATVAATLQ